MPWQVPWSRGWGGWDVVSDWVGGLGPFTVGGAGGAVFHLY